MIFSRHIYLVILTHILLILATSGAGLWMIFSGTGYVIGALLVVCALLQIAGLTKQLNAFNRKIRLFFDAVQNMDNMLYFPEQNVSREQEQLNRSLNRINMLLSDARSETRSREHFYRSVLEEVPSGVIAWNASGKVIISNSAALSLLGSSQLVTRSEVERLLEKSENLSLSQSSMKLNGEVLTLLSLKDIGDELGNKESESWSKLTHVLTHEIMNTIAPIISLSQTLTAYPGINEKTVGGLNIIRSQSERLMEFTESFRRLSYMPMPERKLFSLTSMLYNIRELLHSDFSTREIEFTMNCPPDAIEVNGDENQLSQVLLNLLKNAMQAVEGEKGGVVNVRLFRRDKWLTVDIEDNGPGIAPGLQEKVFIPFFTTKPEGSGIGLSLSRQIVRRHGGHLSIKESRPGKSIFSIDLPE